MSDRNAHYHGRRVTSRSRSRSPARRPHRSLRTRSPHHQHHRHKQLSHPPKHETPRELPYGARQLTKRDYAAFRPMFALYLDVQKQKILEELEEVEAKGRWKSFMGKWNRGELAEGWYDPSTLQKAVTSSRSNEPFGSRDDPLERPLRPRNISRAEDGKAKDKLYPSSDSDDSVGPTLPGKEHSRGRRHGPSIPNMEDLDLKRELEKEDSLTARDDLRDARKADKRTQKEQLEELAPRADAGTRERRLEKKFEVNAKMKAFRERSPGAVEVPESDLLGGGDGVAEYKAAKQEQERKKNEREIRKEEFLRARQKEREERLDEYKAKEEGTMAMLRAIAKERFG